MPLDTQTRPVSGATTPDLIADEKEQQKSYEPSTVGVNDATPDDGPVEEYATGKRLVPVVVALVCSVFLVALDMTIIGTAIPEITSDFDGLNMVSWYGSVSRISESPLSSSPGPLLTSS